MLLEKDPKRPLLNRAIMGTYPPGSTFKITQALTGLQEGSIDTHIAFPCHHGFNYKGLHVGCHGHASPINLVPAIGTSCNSYFCWNLFRLLSNKRKYGSVQKAMTVWKDYMVRMGYGYKLGIDLPGEKRGMIPNAQYYDKAYKGSWNGLTVISIAIGQGEVTATPLQICNLAATVANRGYFYTPMWCTPYKMAASTPFTVQSITQASTAGGTNTVWRACARLCSTAHVAPPIYRATKCAERLVRRKTVVTTTPCLWVLPRCRTPALPFRYMLRMVVLAMCMVCQ